MKKYLFVVVAILLVVCMVGLTACKKDKPQGGDNVIEQPGDNPGGNTDPQDPGETTDPDQPGDNPGDQPGDNPGDNPGDQPGDEPDGPDNPDDPGEEPGEDAYIVSAEKYAEALSFYQKNFNLYATGTETMPTPNT